MLDCTKFIGKSVAVALMFLSMMACNGQDLSPTRFPVGSDVALDLLIASRVDAVADATNLVFRIEFSQAVSREELVQFASIGAVRSHLRGGANVVDAVAALEVTGADKVWYVSTQDADVQNESYILTLSEDIRSDFGRYLDGTREVTGSHGLAAEDYYNAPAPLISEAVQANNLRNRVTTRTDRDRPTLHKISLYREFAGGLFTAFARDPLARPTDNVAILPPLDSTNYAWRVSVTGATEFHRILDPLSVVREIRFVDFIGGARTPFFSYNVDVNNQIDLAASLSITNIEAGSEFDRLDLGAILFDSLLGPEINVNEQDRLRLYVGEDEPANSIMPLVVGYEPIGKRLRVDYRIAENLQFSQSDTNVVSLESPIVPAGYFNNRMRAHFSDGNSSVVVGSDGQNFLLRNAITGNPETVSFRFISVDELQLQLPISAFFVAEYFYLFSASALDNGSLFQLFFGIEKKLQNLMGLGLTDERRDGNEDRVEGRDDKVVISLSVLPDQSFPIPPFMYLNDGFYYPTVFADAELSCESEGTLCVTTNECSGNAINFSFATPDGGSSNPTGSNDLVDIGPNDKFFSLYRDLQPQDGIYDLTIPIQWSTTTIATSPSGSYIGGPADLLTVVPNDRCLGLVEGDMFVISHSIRADVDSDKATLDGNGDGVLIGSVEDDVIRWFAGLPTGFVTYEEYIAITQNP